MWAERTGRCGLKGGLKGQADVGWDRLMWAGLPPKIGPVEMGVSEPKGGPKGKDRPKGRKEGKGRKDRPACLAIHPE